MAKINSDGEGPEKYEAITIGRFDEDSYMIEQEGNSIFLSNKQFDKLLDTLMREELDTDYV